MPRFRTLTLLGVAAPLLGAWLLLFRPSFLGGSADYVIVQGVSMQPTLYTGDLAIVRRKGDYGTGDVVAFRTAGGTVIHRIVGGNAQEGFVVQGDNKKQPDGWLPTPENIRGKMWLHIPGAGRWLAYFRQPLPSALLIGGLGAFAFIGKRQIRRRRNGRWKNMGEQTNTGGHLPAPAWLVVLFGGLCVVAAMAALVALQAFRHETDKIVAVERVRYEHTAGFGYTAKVAPSSLYPDGVIGPVAAPDEGEDQQPAAPIYTSAFPVLDLRLDYELRSVKSPPPAGFGGEVSAVLRIKAGEQGWVKTLDLLPSAPFDGTAASLSIPVDLSRAQALIETVEKETKFTPGSYDISVVPTIRIQGNLGSDAIDEVYEPAFTIRASRNQFTLDPALLRKEAKSRTDSVSEPQDMEVLGVSAPVASVRWPAAGIAAIALAGAAGTGLVVFLGIGRGEPARIRARYGSMVISVTEAHVDADPALQIRLASIHDLVRLARKDSRMVLHQPRPDGSDMYFIQDGVLTYLYVSRSGRAVAGQPSVTEA